MLQASLFFSSAFVISADKTLKCFKMSWAWQLKENFFECCKPQLAVTASHECRWATDAVCVCADQFCVTQARASLNVGLN
jgi:hypothetical protein